MASLRCSSCGAPLIFNGTEYVCSLCASTFKPTDFFKEEETVEEFLEEPPVMEEEEEETLVFTCPKCKSIFEGTPSYCPTCGTKIKYLAVLEEEDIPQEETPKPKKKSSKSKKKIEEETPKEDSPKIEEVPSNKEPIVETPKVEEISQNEEPAQEVKEINIEIEERWPEHDSDYSPLEKLHEKKVISIKRTICYGDHYYLVTYEDGKEDTLSSKGMRLKGLMARK